MKTITIYELLGMIKDGKAPKKVRYRYSCLYEDFKFDGETLNYIGGKDFLFGEDITAMLNDEVEILEEEKKIPEKSILDVDSDVNGSYDIVIINGIEYEINKRPSPRDDREKDTVKCFNQ